MFKSVIAKSITAIAAATVVAGLVVFLTSIAPEAKADPQVTSALGSPQAKSDRLPVVLKGAACSLRGWPHYEQSCQFDRRELADETRTVRVIALR